MPVARGHIVKLAKRLPGRAPPGLSARDAAEVSAMTSRWAAAVETTSLAPVEVVNRPAPDYLRAKVALDLGYVQRHVWRWGEVLNHEDRIVISSDHTEPFARDIFFAGHAVDVDWTFDTREELIVTATGCAARLALDAAYLVFGRYIFAANGDVMRFSGLPCVFNAGGRPNRHQNLQADFGAGAPAGGVPVFTADGDPNAIWWTPVEIFVYLLWRHNYSEYWLGNPTFTRAEYSWSANRPVTEIPVEGLSLWAALGAVADKAGYDVAEVVTNNGAGGANHSIDIIRRHTGDEFVVSHQAPNAAGTFATLAADPNKPAGAYRTNLFAATIAETTVPSIARPLVMGGRELTEISIELGKAWDPALLEIPTDSTADPNVDARAATTYFNRYCRGGTSFNAYMAVGRLWDANTDGRYSAAPYNLSEPDVAALAGFEAGTFPVMAFRPRPCLTKLGDLTDGVTSGTYVEVSFDGGASWRPLPGTSLLPDRLGIIITTPNLATVQTGDGGKPHKTNLFFKLADDAADVKIRLTCTIAVPLRNWNCPARRSSSGTMFDQGATFDKGVAGQIRLRAASSRFTSTGLAADEVTVADATEDLERLAAQLQDAAEDRLLEANLPLGWIDASVRIGMVVNRIAGLGYNLRSNAGARTISPRIVGYTHSFRPDEYNTQIILDTDRKAGVI